MGGIIGGVVYNSAASSNVDVTKNIGEMIVYGSVIGGIAQFSFAGLHLIKASEFLKTEEEKSLTLRTTRNGFGVVYEF